MPRTWQGQHSALPSVPSDDGEAAKGNCMKFILKAGWILILLYFAVGLSLMITFDRVIGPMPISESLVLSAMWPILVVMGIIFAVAAMGQI